MSSREVSLIALVNPFEVVANAMCAGVQDFGIT